MTKKDESLKDQTVLEEAVYTQLQNNSEQPQKEEQKEFSDEEISQMQDELQKHFNKFKKKFKVKSKSELVAIIWEQGMQYKQLQDIAQELFEENKALKGASNVKKGADTSS